MASHNQDQFVKRFMRYQDRVYRYITTLIPNRADAEEIFQQTSLVLWKKWERFDPDRDFVPWACGIAHNEVRNFLRKHERRNVYMGAAAMDALSKTYQSSQDLLESRRHALDDCMKKLTPKQRQVMQRCYGSGEPIRAVAEKEGQTPNALYLVLRRIRRLLMECVSHTLAKEVDS